MDFMSAGQLFCLLESVHKLYHSQYQWFFIGTDSVYLSMSCLERLLQTLGSSDTIVYMGRPHTEKGYCMGESGIILSQVALRQVVPHLQQCLEANLSAGDVALGACFESKLQKTCYKVSYVILCMEVAGGGLGAQFDNLVVLLFINNLSWCFFSFCT